MPFDLPGFNGGRVRYQRPKASEQKNEQSKHGQAVDHKKYKKVDELTQSGTKVLFNYQHSEVSAHFLYNIRWASCCSSTQRSHVAKGSFQDMTFRQLRKRESE
jgi:hypothetical protein